MAAYRGVDDLRSPAVRLPVYRDQLRAQRSVSSVGLHERVSLAMRPSSATQNIVFFLKAQYV